MFERRAEVERVKKRLVLVKDQVERPSWLPHEEFPFVSRFAEIEGHRIHYVDEGDGPVLLFANAGLWSFVWRDLIVRLRDRFRCVALDFPGAGLSSAAEGYRGGLEASSRVLEGFVRELDLRDVTLVLHDLGGPVGLGAGVRMPERIRGIAIVESFGWPLGFENPKVARILRMTGAIRGIDPVTSLAIRFTSGSYGVGRDLSPAARRAFRGPFRDREVRRRTFAMLGEAGRSDELFARIERAQRTVLGDRPIALVFGAESPSTKEGFPERWKSRFPNADLLIVDGAHHFPMADDPDLVARALAGWWREEVRAA